MLKVGRATSIVSIGAACRGGRVAGLAGMVASQEVRADDPRARDAMWVHGIGNLGILLGGVGLATWRSTRRATVASAVLAATAVGASLYTAWLGGQLVYTHGVGVKAFPATAANGVAEAIPLRSLRAPGRLLRDAARGLGWLLTRGGRLADRREPLAQGAATQADLLPQQHAPTAPIIPAAGPQVRPIG